MLATRTLRQCLRILSGPRSLAPVSLSPSKRVTWQSLASTAAPGCRKGRISCPKAPRFSGSSSLSDDFEALLASYVLELQKPTVSRRWYVRVGGRANFCARCEASQRLMLHRLTHDTSHFRRACTLPDESETTKKFVLLNPSGYHEHNNLLSVLLLASSSRAYTPHHFLDLLPSSACVGNLSQVCRSDCCEESAMWQPSPRKDC